MTADPIADSPMTPTRPRRLVRWLVSAALLYHVAAVIVAPLSMPPSSDLVQTARVAFRPYVQALYLDHGYRFFAPEPGESALVSYVVERKDAPPVTGRFPHRSIVPRLLYHRHFMLSEHANQAPPELVRPWYASYARHLCHEYDGTQVGLTRVMHGLPLDPAMIRNGITLDHPGSYREQPLGVFRCE